ncbi:MAG: alpha/beta hydrolase [Gammaproteobacteria bacterium]|nr:alpha/beta hydrolase [Gammaproteobacteria bacterium]
MTSIASAIRQSCNQLRGRTSSSNKTRPNRRVVPPLVRLTGLAFNLLSRIHLQAAAGKLSEFWFTVFQARPRPWVHRFWKQADRSFELHLADKWIPVHLWGEGPLVVCMHGWSGSGTQFRHFIPALQQAGYQVALFDAPAHGINPGRQTHLLDFSDCLQAIEQQIAPIHTVIAHSFGAMATLMAGRQGLQAKQMVLLAPGLDVQDIFASYCDSLKLQPDLVAAFRNRVGQKMAEIVQIDDPWAFFHPRQSLQYASERGLLLYDTDDEELSQSQFEQIGQQWAQCDVVTTRDLGHIRILKDAQVVKATVDWIDQA